jgi:serine/threonine protein kinase
MINDNTNTAKLVSLEPVFETQDNKTVVLDANSMHHNTLPIGTRFGEFEIIGLVGEGGFGIVYLVQDHSLGRKVAIKEYMPSLIAARATNATVAVRSEQHRATFETGRRSFVNEARLLAQFDHPALVKVYRFWEANGTAYMVMPYYEGRTLREALKARVRPVDENWIRKILLPVTDALALIHRDNCLHRDIAPDNIMLLERNDRPVLLDFGAARRVIGDMTQAPTVILKPGFAPVEQYSDLSGMQQGPWTDVYALAAVIHFMLLGKTPPSSIDRLMRDTYQPLALVAAGRLSDAFLRGVDRCLSIRVEDRPQSMAQMRETLGWSLGALQPIPPVVAVSSGPAETPAGQPAGSPDKLIAVKAALARANKWLTAGVALVKANKLMAVGAALTLVLGGYLLLRGSSAPASKSPAVVESPPREVKPARKPTPPVAPTPASSPALLRVPVPLNAPVLPDVPALPDVPTLPDALVPPGVPAPSGVLAPPSVPAPPGVPAPPSVPVPPSVSAPPSAPVPPSVSAPPSVPASPSVSAPPKAPAPSSVSAPPKAPAPSSETTPPGKPTPAGKPAATSPRGKTPVDKSAAAQPKISNYYDVLAAEEKAKPKPVPAAPKPAPVPAPQPKPKPAASDMIRSLRDRI